MPSALFAALAAKAGAAADAVFAEPWLLKPRIAGSDKNVAMQPDPSRASVTFLGTFADPEAKPDMPNSYDRHEVRRPGVESGHPRLTVSAAEMAKGLVIRRGDLLVRQNDGVSWSVAAPFPMAAGTLKLHLNLVG